MEVTGKTEEEIWGYSLDQEDLKLNFQKWLEEFVDPMDKADKLHFVAYNAEFDYRFIRTLWEELEDTLGNLKAKFPDKKAMIEEKYGDSINYHLLSEALFTERRENEMD